MGVSKTDFYFYFYICSKQERGNPIKHTQVQLVILSTTLAYI